MKFQPDQFGAAITGYGPGWIAVGGQRIEHSVLLGNGGEITAWPCARFEDLTPAHFSALAAARPELVVLGSGRLLRLPHPSWVRELVEAGIGIETMDTGAACRTYNIVAAEGRRVMAALLLEQGEKVTDGLK